MKLVHKYIASFCFSSILVLGAGCSSTKQSGTAMDEGDTYISEKEENETKLPKKTTNKTSGKSSSFADLFKSKFVTIGETTIYTPQIFGGIKQTEAEIVYYPKNDTAGFGSSFKALYYYLTFDDSARNSLIKDVDRYFSDFDEKKLSRTAKKTEKAYGKINVDVTWGTIKGNSPNYGSGSLNVGYQFVEKSPYFILTLYPIDNIPFETGAVNEPKSLKLEYFFTKNQARMLADALKDEALESKIWESEGISYDYYESEDEYVDSAENSFEEIDEVEEIEEAGDVDVNE